MTTCVRCHKPLSDPNSVSAGMGPICAHAMIDRNSDVASREKFSDQFDTSIPFGKALVMERYPRPVDRDANLEIEVGGAITNVPHLVVHHSPDGFEFGYGGSGPADLALNACQLYLNMVQYSGQKTKCYDGNCWTLAWILHQDFKREFIAGTNRKGAIIPFDTMASWFEANMTGQLLNQCAVESDELIEEE